MLFLKANVSAARTIPRGITISANLRSKTTSIMSADSIFTAIPAKPGMISV